MSSNVLPLVHPSTMMIAGPTGSGKTRFVLDLLRHKMFEVSQNELNTKDLERPSPTASSGFMESGSPFTNG